MSCEHCNGGGCGGCGSCGELALTLPELALLRCLGQTPFLPIAAARDREKPICLEEPEASPAVLLALAAKGLIRLDYDLPLKNFDYEAYRDIPLHGSMALTAWGQEVLEQIEIQGIEE
ncbi:hypothetical protein AALC17_06360 [Oscillospiraceae bacterium 38-13]